MPDSRRERIDYLGNREVEVVSKSRLGQTTFVSVEYPGILSTRVKNDVGGGYTGTQNALDSDGVDYNADIHPSLVKALASLAPVPFPYATANLGLEHIQQVVQGKQKAIECRLFHAIQAGPSQAGPSQARVNGIRSDNAIYRHGLHGDFVKTHNIFIKLRKRVWRRKRRDGGAGSSDGNSGENTRKEYAIETLGVTKQTARFRTLADYLYDPGFVRDPGTGRSDPVNAQALDIHDSIRQMDVDALWGYNIAEEEDEYRVTDPAGNVVTNVRMPPVPLFDKSEGPYPYGFRQNSTSEIKEVVDAAGNTRKRYVNTNRKAGSAPEPFDLFSKENLQKAPPSAPAASVAAYRFDNRLLDEIARLFAEQPMWSRLSLMNHFNKVDRTKIRNQKHHISKSCYTISEGCWRDNLVRFGYDPRKDPNARLYQRIILQGKGRGGRAAQTTEAAEAGNDDDDEEAEAGQAGGAVGDHEDERHTFDGVTLGLTRGNYLLIDIQDEIVRELIDKSGPGFTVDDASQVKKLSGWYTKQHWTRIRHILKFRWDALKNEKRPATRDECMKELQKLELSMANANRKRSASGTSSPEATRDGRQESEEHDSLFSGDDEADEEDVEMDTRGEEQAQEQDVEMDQSPAAAAEPVVSRRDSTASSDEQEQQPRPREMARRGSGRRGGRGRR